MDGNALLAGSSFDPAFNFMLSQERGIEQNPADPGGISNFGISLRTLSSLSLNDLASMGLPKVTPDADTVRTLHAASVRQFYKAQFWDKAPFEQIPYQTICNYLFDAAVNMGIAPAVKCLQRAIWAVTKDDKSLPDDGILGEETLSAIKRSGVFINMALRSERAGYYRMLAAGNAGFITFLNGWLNRAYTS